MAKLKVGIIGCGIEIGKPGATGYGMAHRHVEGYKASPDVELAALADLVPERAKAFQAEHGGGRVYQDHREMLRREKLDIVSICTWPDQHARLVIDAAEAGVRAIHCEKPMALTYGDALREVRVCKERRVQLTFGHQRRFGEGFIKARELLRSGAIGNLIRLEAQCGDLYDWGTHWFDTMAFYNDDAPVVWVLGQIELRGHHKVFGADVEGQGVSYFKYRNGVIGLLVTGFEANWGALNRLIGTDGVIEVASANGGKIRWWGKGQAAWQDLTVGEDWRIQVKLGILDLIDALKTGCEPEMSGRKALAATELIFATWESSRRRGRVDLPLDIEDSPLVAMLG